MAVSEDNRTALLNAILDQDAEQLSTHELDVNDTDLPIQLRPNDKHVSALMVCSHFGFTECTRKLFEKKTINLFNLTTTYRRALVLALCGGHSESARLLSRRGLFQETALAENKTLYDFVLAIDDFDFDLAMGLLDRNRDKGWLCGVEGVNLMNFLILQGCPANCVRSMIDHGVSVNQGDRHGLTPLMTAVMPGNIDCAQALIQGGADVDLHDKRDPDLLMVDTYNDDGHRKENSLGDIVHGEGKTALMYAVLSKKMDSVILLLGHGANVNQIDEGGLTALMHATCVGNSESVKQILDTDGVHVNQTDNRQKSALIHAAYAGDRECVGLLLQSQAEADLSHSDCDGRTAFMAGIISNNLECVSLFLDLKREMIDVTAVDSKGKSSLAYAAESDNAQMLEALILLLTQTLSFPNNNIKDYLNKVLHPATVAGALDCVDVLLQHGCDIDYRESDDGPTPLCQACRYRRNEVAYWLVRHGANVNAFVRKDLCRTVLMYAVLFHDRACVDLVEFLLENGANLEDLTVREETPLMLALLHGRPKCTELLIKYGANTSAIDFQNQSVFKFAAMGGYFNCFEIMLNLGLDADTVDVCGGTVFSHVLRPKFSKFLKALIQKGNLFEDEGRTKLKKVHRLAIKRVRGIFGQNTIHVLMETGVFDWGSCSCSNLIQTSFAAVYTGAFPKELPYHYDDMEFDRSVDRVESTTGKSDGTRSLLRDALLADDHLVVRFLLANLYITTPDRMVINSSRFQTAVRSKGHGRYIGPLLNQLVSNPWRLEILCYLKIMESISSRESISPMSEIIDSLPIPECMKRILKCQGPLSKLCPSDWESIGNRPGTEESQELLTLTKLVWPSSQSLVQCERQHCKCEGLGMAIQHQI